MARVLLVDDDLSLVRALRVGLGAGGHEVIAARNGEQGIEQVALTAPDVVVLDLGLPDLDGLSVCRRIRAWSDVPIIVLSAADAEPRKVAALNAGADDYVTKPFGMAELEARIRTAIRHRRPNESEQPVTVEIGPLVLDIARREARHGNSVLELTAKEFDLLAFLGRHEGRVSTHEIVLRAVWGEGYQHEAQYLHAYVHRLRQKLRGIEGLEIRTVPGIGYVLSVETPPSEEAVQPPSR